jgi:hypothetical protein
MTEKSNANRILAAKSEGKTPIGRPRRRWQDNTKTNITEVGWAY